MTNEQLRTLAAVGVRERIATIQAELTRKRRRRMSRKARAAISAAQKARWAKAKKRAANG